MNAARNYAEFRIGTDEAPTVKRPWSPAEERELADLYAHGYRPMQLSLMLGRSVGAINGKLDYMLVERRTKYRAWNIQEIRTAQRLRAEGLSLAKIGKELGRSGTSVRHALIDAERRAA